VTTLAYRVLATELAKAGIAALRFDLQGTGDSAGSQLDPGRVAAWQDSVEQALAEGCVAARGLPLFAVGMRVGALLLAQAASQQASTPLDAIVLWDPCATGASFLRESKALRRIALGASGDREGYVEGLGLELSDDDADRLGRLQMPAVSGVVPRVLALHRGSEPSKRLVRQLGGGVTWLQAPDQDVLLDPEWIQPRAPMGLCRQIAAWLASAAPEPAQGVVVAPALRTITTLPAGDGAAITERFVKSLVPGHGARLFGVLTQPANAAADRASVEASPVLVFLNSSIETHIGPSRMWTEIARAAARNGISSLRLDLSGIGESGVRPGQPWNTTYAPEAVDDVKAAVSALCGEGVQGVTLIGLCSGAYTAVEAGLALQPRRVVPVNLPTRFFPPEIKNRGEQVTRQATQLPPGPLRALVRLGWLRKLGHKLPAPVFRSFETIGILRSPLAPFEQLTKDGVAVTLIVGPEDAKPFIEGRRRRLRALERGGRFRLRIIEPLDHGAIRAAGQRALLEAVSELIFAEIPASPRAGAVGPRAPEYATT
jgi:alpha-beta hydrolase superfamily lysophospholipase